MVLVGWMMFVENGGCLEPQYGEGHTTANPSGTREMYCSGMRFWNWSDQREKIGVIQDGLQGVLVLNEPALPAGAERQKDSERQLQALGKAKAVLVSCKVKYVASSRSYHCLESLGEPEVEEQ
jgi:hypothetical protein